MDLGKVRMINYIELFLGNDDIPSYCYYIDVSLDGKEYKRIIDHTGYCCRSLQRLHFPWHRVQFIRLVGTNLYDLDILEEELSGGGYKFVVDSLKAMYVDDSDAQIGFYRPTKNVANPKIGATVLEGDGGNNMLDNNMETSTRSAMRLDKNMVLLQLNQPYYISSIRMLLGSKRNYKKQFSFYIETSTISWLSSSTWQMAVDKREESLSGWQQFEFEERLVSYVKIIGVGEGVSNFLLSVPKLWYARQKF